MRIGFLGFGLIGGSIARALRARRPDWPMSAWTPTGAGPRQAVEDGVLDVAAADAADAVTGADLVVLAAPPLATLALLDALAGDLRGRMPGGAAITDVASTKRQIVARADRLGLPFVGGHPMAGVEATGYAAADPDLFVDRPWIVTPGPAGAVERVEQLATATGARPVRLDAATHDAAVAAISHLPLVLSAALAASVDGTVGDGGPDPRTLAAGGWRDMTRLARGDVEMGAGILATNADGVAAQLRAVRTVIDAWLAALEADAVDVGRLRERLQAARDAVDPRA